MKIKYNYLQQEFEDVESIFKEWQELIKSTEYTLGSYVEKFEDEFSRYVGAKHCISTNNGTDALILSLRALNIGPGDEVITVNNTFYATVGAIVAVGATPVLVDCDERFQISVKDTESQITKNTKAIIPVHWAGASPDMEMLMDLASHHKLEVIEDACMGIGGRVGKAHPGTIGQLGACSAHPLKSLNAIGDGGMVITNNDSLAKWMRMYRNHGMINRDQINIWGVNMRMQPLQAIVLRHGLTRLNKTISVRNKNAARIDELLSNLSDNVTLPKRLSENQETFSLYMGLFEYRDELRVFLDRCGIETKIHYPIPLHLQKAAQNVCRFNIDSLGNSIAQSKKLLTLPVHQFISENQIEYMCEKISSFYSVGHKKIND